MLQVSREMTDCLISWFKKNGRNMPWRGETDPYKIWISEVLLQQTQVITVIPYYNKWLKVYPTVSDLASASLQDVLKIWEGLGYYSRARNLHKGAKTIVEALNGVFPDSREALQKIPGIGDYTSSAIASIAFNHPHGVLDGNTKRVMARLFLIEDRVTSKRFQNKVTQLINSSLAWGEPRWINQAWMELGALICTVRPSCSLCTLQKFCEANRHNRMMEIPNKPDKKKIPLRNGAIFIIRDSKRRILMVKRRDKGLLPGLWELPNTLYDEQPLSDFIMANDIMINRSFIQHAEHAYSHFKVRFELYEAYINSSWRNDYWTDFNWICENNLNTLPRPNVHIKAMKIAGLL
jgi:A/G-specific adenine glycosylase